jgi:uncharacterized membrane protein YphA (DoxX/SURF4 family)
LFSGFPDGKAGLGLLLLRVTLGAALLGQCVLSFGRGLTASWSGALDLLSILTASALVAGAFTPAAGVVAASLCVIRPFGPPAAAGAFGFDGAASLGLLCVMGVTVSLLGPGAFSVDARVFGRREIVVPRASRGGSRVGAEASDPQPTGPPP